MAKKLKRLQEYTQGNLIDKKQSKKNALLNICIRDG